MELGCLPVVVLREGGVLEKKRSVMARTVLPNQNDLSRQVLRIVRKKKMCDLDELQECTSYSWSQVFLEVDHLSRTGELRLLCKKAGAYTETLPRAP